MMNIVFSMLLYYLSSFRYIIILLNKSIIILFRSTKLFYLANAKMVGGLECFPISANDVPAKIFFYHTNLLYLYCIIPVVAR